MEDLQSSHLFASQHLHQSQEGRLSVLSRGFLRQAGAAGGGPQMMLPFEQFLQKRVVPFFSHFCLIAGFLAFPSQPPFAACYFPDISELWEMLGYRMEDFLIFFFFFTDNILSAGSVSDSSTHPGRLYAKGSGIFFVLDQYDAGHMLVLQSCCAPWKLRISFYKFCTALE